MTKMVMVPEDQLKKALMGIAIIGVASIAGMRHSQKTGEKPVIDLDEGVQRAIDMMLNASRHLAVAGFITAGGKAADLSEKTQEVCKDILGGYKPAGNA